MIRILRAKLHGIRVTSADLNYHGSITLDPIHCRQAGLYPLEFVEVWNKQSGARLQTYVIFGEPGSQCCVLNGAAARTCQVGDELIIAASEYLGADALTVRKARVLIFNSDNSVGERLEYRVNENDDFYEFHTVEVGQH